MIAISSEKAISFAFPGLNISLLDQGSSIKGYVADVLERWGEPTSETGLPLEIRSFPADRWTVKLPQWVVERVPRIIPAEETAVSAQVFYGPSGLAVVMITAKEFHAALWDQQTSIITYHYFSDQKPENTFSTGLIQAVMKPLLREILAARGHFMIHAAAVMIGEKVGALLVGQGGAGKTTTALSLVRMGGRIISDDTVTLSYQGEMVMSHRWIRSFHITAKTAKFFEELAPFPSAEDMLADPDRVPDPRLGTISGEKKMFFGPDLENIYDSSCVIESCPVEAIYFLKLTPGSPEILEAPVAYALTVLTSAHNFASGQRLSSEAAELLTDLIDRAMVFTLHTGSDPIQTGQKLMEHLGQLASLSGRVSK
jgi:hypothetical protein